MKSRGREEDKEEVYKGRPAAAAESPKGIGCSGKVDLEQMCGVLEGVWEGRK